MAATPERAGATNRVNGADQSRRRAKQSAISVTIGRTIDTPSATKRARKSTTGVAVSALHAESLEVLELAFTRCEGRDRAAVAAPCPRDPGWICAGCGTLVCADHARAGDGAPGDGIVPCSDCGAAVVDLRSAALDLVLDARLRRHPD